MHPSCQVFGKQKIQFSMKAFHAIYFNDSITDFRDVGFEF
jgi:hypothetical protein